MSLVLNDSPLMILFLNKEDLNNMRVYTLDILVTMVIYVDISLPTFVINILLNAEDVFIINIY